MHGWATLALAAAAASMLAAAGKPSGTLDSAIEALGADRIASIEYSGSGKWYQIGRSQVRRCPLRSST